ncbi:ATP-binding protein [Acholeplasma palmae]|uniref:ATP-binding protein n=1 Tax=Acholeplasma palmae TaxID=38986 RepID=UPI0005F9DC1E|nr:ATP-binding protein [Alteracholeplasma palmae]
MDLSIKVNLKQRVRNLNIKLTDLWFPLFEAVINSFQSIQERDKSNSGNITIKITRKNSTLPDDIGEIDTIEILDDGIGFNDKNFDAFRTSDTDNKIVIGGKGVGRLTWAKVFGSAVIDSNYYDDEKIKRRHFIFSENGFEDYQENILADQKAISGTHVKLRNMNSQYSANSAIELKEIATELMKHISVYLMNNEKIKVDLIELKTNEIINLNYTFFTEYIKKQEVKEIYIDDHRFFIRHVFSINKLAKGTNIAFFCAQNRVVNSVELDKYIELPETYLIDDKELYYSCYITSKYLDEDVSSERLAFNNFIYEKKEKSGMTGLNGFERINESVSYYLESYIKKIYEQKEDIIKEYISKEQPHFNYFYHHKSMREKLRSIPYRDVTDNNKLYEELRKIDSGFYIDTRKKVEQDEVTQEQIKEIVNAIDDTSKSSLAEYIVRRKLLIELLESKLGKTNEKYERESIMHNILFPMKESLDTIDYESHNLWLIDERLSFSYSGFSDIPLRKIMKTKEDTRPDLVFINSFTNSENKDKTTIDSMTIVEIKKPGRKNYSDGGPDNQLIKYIRTIKAAGEIYDYNERVYSLANNIAFTCYIIGDLTREMKEMLEDAKFTTADNGEKYTSYNPNNNAYFEFISFSKLVKDAKLRNKIFTKKINLVE